LDAKEDKWHFAITNIVDILKESVDAPLRKVYDLK
jgi:hypothetical protein